MTLDQISQKVLQALKQISDTNSLVWSTTEWAICTRITNNLRGQFPDFDIDTDLRKQDGRRPDIVIHHLGNQDQNLVAIQVKKNPSTKDIQDDLDKITSTLFSDPYNYKFGIFISVGQLPKKLPQFDPNRIRIIEVHGWRIIPS